MKIEDVYVCLCSEMGYYDGRDVIDKLINETIKDILEYWVRLSSSEKHNSKKPPRPRNWFEYTPKSLPFIY